MQPKPALPKQIETTDPSKNEKKEVDELANMFAGLSISLSPKEEKEYGAITHKMKQHGLSPASFTLEDYRTMCSFDKLPKNDPSIQISADSLKRIVLGHQLNDQAINTRIGMLRQLLPEGSSTRLLNSFFVGLLEKGNADRILKKFKIDQKCRLVIPIHHKGCHWITAVVQEGNIDIYDSLPFSGVPNILKTFFSDYYGKPCEISVCDFPRQDNHIDCGVFLLCGVEDIIQHRPWTFDQKDIYSRRLSLARNILATGQTA